MTTDAGPSFIQLNEGWNAEPNAPHPRIKVVGTDLFLKFFVNCHQFPQLGPDELGIIRFSACSRYRIGATNDEGWYRGQCRYSAVAPAWGQFYEIVGTDVLLDEPKDWQVIETTSNASGHFLFYLRDETFECIAADWEFAPDPVNALTRMKRALQSR